MKEYQPRLEFTRFEVHLIYGFALQTVEPLFDAWFENRLLRSIRKGEVDRSGWTPMYRLPAGSDAVVQERLPYRDNSKGADARIRDIDFTPPSIWQQNTDEKNQPAEEFADKHIRAEVDFSYALKKSGAGALTIRLKFRPETDSAVQFTTADVLTALLLAPRTEHGMPSQGVHDDTGRRESRSFNWVSELSQLSESAMESVQENLQKSFDDPLVREHSVTPDLTNDCSPAFKLFLLGMTRMIHNLAQSQQGASNQTIQDKKGNGLFSWSEFGSPSTINQADRVTDSFPIYHLAQRDPQIPYFYVVGVVPEHIYYDSFAQRPDSGFDYSSDRSLRSRFTKDIASILNRWLIDRNIPYVSYDQLEREDLIRNGAFLSHYMNSLLFTTFSGIAALTLQPAEESDPNKTDTNSAKKLPFEPAIHSILRFVEYSRMRWHQGIGLNRALDELVDRARDAEGIGIRQVMRDLLELRLKVAKYMQNPITYRWDATVGTAVARYIHEQVIGELEAATTRKLSLIKEVLVDRLDILQSEAVFRAVQNSGFSRDESK
jgi:hypothetical protein